MISDALIQELITCPKIAVGAERKTFKLEKSIGLIILT